ncbi:MAG: SDR family NAD(P)-dependent oxidoreductase [Actinobacteria bacterium]|nr:SDR family NAD(P)-dependent oxidoreductase [Actinomycetota bacterium]
MPCDHQHVVITGTSSGIGQATMDAALAAGWHVFAGDRTSSGVGRTSRVSAGLLTAVHLDITIADQVAAAAKMVAEHVGDSGLNGLANVAGVGVPGPLETMPIDKLRFSFEVDVLGQVALTQALLPIIRKAQGRIVFVGSIADRISPPYFGALSSSKSAIAAINDTFRQELSPWGIKVILVEPGFISTGADETTGRMIDQVLADFTPEQAQLYGDAFSRATKAGKKTQAAGSPPQGVAATILEALTTKKPKDRYLTGSKSHAAAAMAKLPRTVQDELARKAFDQSKPGSLAD